MADDKNVPNGSDGISIADEDAITEIDIGSFLNDRNSDAVLYEGFHEDIEKTEQSLEDEIQSLMDSILSTGPATIVPKPLDSIVSEARKEPTPMDDMWMNPEEYIDVPEAPKPEKPADAEPAEPVRKVEKEEIFDLLDALKAETESAESGYNEILEGIENNEGLKPVDVDAEYQPVRVSGEAPEGPQDDTDGSASDDIDIHGEDFDRELAILLGDAPSEEPAAAAESAAVPEYRPAPGTGDIYSGTSSGEMEDISSGAPMDDTYEPEEITFENLDDAGGQNAPRVYVDALTPNTGKTVGVVPTEIYEDDGKVSRKEKRAAKKAARNPDDPDAGSADKGDAVRKIVLVIAILTIIVSGGVLVYTYLINPIMTKNKYSTVKEMLPTADDTSETEVVEDDSDYPEGMLAKYKELYKQNPDIAGWINIDAFDINLPIMKATEEEEALDGQDNSYYLRRDFYGNKNQYGVPFFDSRISDLRSLPRNTIVYGHNMHYDNLIFGLLENYREIDGYKSAPVIECNTIYGDYKWKVYAVFFTGSTAEDDNGYMFNYNFLDISDEKFEGYIEEIDKRKLYDTGVDINTSDKILTLSTCAYDFEGERLVVVARLVRDGESENVDTSKVVKNSNPKYPQAWYDAKNKENPYAGQSTWTP